MAPTKRYDVGPEQGFRQATTIKLTDAEAKARGLGPKHLSKMKTTADDLAHRNRYDEAMTSQERMRAAEETPAEETPAEETPAEETPAENDDDQADAGNKKRGTTSKK